MTTFEIDTELSIAPQHVPVGLILKSGDHTVIRTYAGWTDSAGGYHAPEQDWPGYRIVRVPDEPSLSLTRYIQQFRTTMLGASIANSISLGNVKPALEAIGCYAIEAPVSVGMMVHYSDQETLGEIPDGSILRHGLPDLWEAQSYYVVQGYRIQHVLGPLRVHAHDVFEVHSMPDGREPLDWAVQPWDDSMRAELDAFKDRAWDLGLKAKQTHQWCGQYEVAMARMGLTREWADRPREMTPEQVRALPVGTVLVGWNADDPSQFAFWRRTDDATNEWRVEHVFGELDDDYPSDGMGLTVAQQATVTGTAIRIFNIEQMNALPIGSVLNNNSTQVTKIEAGWAQRPMQPDPALITAARLATQYGINTLVSLGTGAYRLAETFTIEQMESEPVGTVFVRADRRYDNYEMLRRGPNGMQTLVRRGEVNAEMAPRLVAEAGEPMLVPHWRLLTQMPVQTVLTYGTNAVRYVKGTRGWMQNGTGSPIRSEDFSSAALQGTLKISHYPERDTAIDPRVGQRVTDEMIPNLPVGTGIRGTQSGRLYVLQEDGLHREGGRRYEWSSLNLNNMLIETIPEPETTEVQTQWPEHEFEVGQRLRHETVDISALDQLPPGSELFGLGSRHIYRREPDGGWHCPDTDDHYRSCSGFNPGNCYVHALAAIDGSGDIERSENLATDYPRS